MSSGLLHWRAMSAIPESAALTGDALTIWREVVCGGEHLAVSRGGQRVAVILPVEDYDAMTAQVNGSEAEEA